MTYLRRLTTEEWRWWELTLLSSFSHRGDLYTFFLLSLPNTFFFSHLLRCSSFPVHFRGRLARIADSIYEDFVVPNPYDPDPSSPGRNTLRMSTVCLGRILDSPLFIFLCRRRLLAFLVRPPRIQCQTHVGRFIPRRNLSGVRVIRLPLAIGVRAAHFCPTLCAPPTGGDGEITVFLSPGARFSMGYSIRWMFGRPIRPQT